MRSRNIKPGFYKNEELACLTFQARLLFTGLWCMADREGRLEKRPLRIKAEIFPYDSLDINGELTVIEQRGFVQTYVVDGKEYLQVINFKKHQSPHHTEAKSKLPEMTEENKITVNSPLSLREYPPDSLIHRFTDSKEKSLPLLLPLTEMPPFAEDVPEKTARMTITDISFLHNDSFGFPMNRGCNNLAAEFCQHYTADEIRQAFEIVSSHHPDKHNMAYLKTVLSNIRKPKLAVVRPQEPEAYDYPSLEKQAALRAHLAMQQAKEEALNAA